MEQEKALRLLLRQLKDIKSQADNILTGENSSEKMETFARYFNELKDFIEKNIESQEVQSYLVELPEVNYSRTQIHLWQYLIFPVWWIGLYRDYQAKNKTMEEINHVRGKCATLELLIKGLSN
jgi:hypothetical protein